MRFHSSIEPWNSNKSLDTLRTEVVELVIPSMLVLHGRLKRLLID